MAGVTLKMVSKIMKARTLKDCLKDPRVVDVSDERQDSHGIWIYLKRPYYNPVTETSHIHEDSVKDCLYILNNEIIENEPFWNRL